MADGDLLSIVIVKCFFSSIETVNQGALPSSEKKEVISFSLGLAARGGYTAASVNNATFRRFLLWKKHKQGFELTTVRSEARHWFLINCFTVRG